MAGLLFVGFDINKSNASLVGLPASPNTTSANQWANVFSRPKGVYHNKGAATQDGTIAPPGDAGAAVTGQGCLYSGRIAGGAYGSVNGTSGYNASSNTTRSVWATAQGHQLAFNRSEIGIGAEIWMTADVAVYLPNLTLSSAYLPTNNWAALFRWGDVEVYFKQTTYAAASHTVIFSIRNNGVEIATHTTIGYVDSYLFCKIRVKLDATTGSIEFSLNNVAQSASYTNQNTVQVISLAAATNVFFGPYVADNGSIAYVGFIDNVYIDDSSYPAGRINIAAFTLLADDTLSDFSAVGTSPTTVVNALFDQTDAKAARASTGLGSAILTQTPPSTTGYLANVVGIEMVAKRVTTRDALGARRLAMGYSLSGTQTIGIRSRSVILPVGVSAGPPETAAASTHTVEQVFTKNGGGLMTVTELASMKVVLKSSPP